VGGSICTSVAVGIGPCVGGTRVGGTDVGKLPVSVAVYMGVAVRMIRGVEDSSGKTTTVAVAMRSTSVGVTMIDAGVSVGSRMSGSSIRLIK
jgi:hypothetical protein